LALGVRGRLPPEALHPAVNLGGVDPDQPRLADPRQLDGVAVDDPLDGGDASAGRQRRTADRTGVGGLEILSGAAGERDSRERRC
jgi:hypothetical protein